MWRWLPKHPKTISVDVCDFHTLTMLCFTHEQISQFSADVQSQIGNMLLCEAMGKKEW